MANNKYAIYPGSVTLYTGSVQTFTAAELAALYGISAEPYIVISTPAEELTGEEYIRYIHLKPRKDGRYYDVKLRNLDDGETINVYEEKDIEEKKIDDADRSFAP